MNRLPKRMVFFLVILLLSPSLALAWQGKVVGVIDGDTLDVLNGGRAERIRLYGVDAPERHQDFGTRSKQFTSELVYGKTVEVTPVDTDRYHRSVSLVSISGRPLQEALVAEGMAWVYPQYCTIDQCGPWKRLEAQAKSAQKGLWSIPEPTPPWQFRKTEKTSKAVAPKPAAPVTAAVFRGNTESRAFHRAGCKWFDCKACTADFNSREEALAAGYHPCGLCKP